jgi:hypothetical protein
MPAYSPAPLAVRDLAQAILQEYDTHRPTLDAGVKIDYVFAFADLDPDSGEKINDAIRVRGFRALGVTRKLPLKDRSMGRGDAEITIDGDWWNGAGDADRKSLLDHELHHIEVKTDKRGALTDDLGRPLLKMRRHDREYGWFDIIAKRHGKHSQEVQQAQHMMDRAGQLYFPELAAISKAAAQAEASITLSIPGGQPVTVSQRRFRNIANDLTP